MALARAIFTIGKVGVDRIHQDQYWCQGILLELEQQQDSEWIQTVIRGFFFSYLILYRHLTVPVWQNTVFSW
jgi:hypothetical protein